MSLTELAIRKNRVTLIGLAVILIGGLLAYADLPRDYDPGFVLRVARVVTFFPGAGPERVEQLVTDKLEKVIQEIPELDYIKSQSKTGVSIVDVWIQDKYKNMRPVWDNLRRKVDRVRSELPDAAMEPIVNDEFADIFGILIALTGEGYSYAEMKTVADEVKDELLRLPDVAKVSIYGHQEERVFIEYSNARLKEIGLSPYHLMTLLKSRNIIIPGGAVTLGPERVVLEPSGNFDSVAELSRTLVHVPGKTGSVYLGDIVDIRRGYVDPASTMMRAMNTPALGLAVSMRKGGNLIDLGHQVKTLVERLQGYYPIGIDFRIINFSPEEVADKVDRFMKNLFQSIAVVMAVMLISLGVRTGLVVATLIPMAMLMSLMVMRILGIGIDQMSLAALIISLGMLVDNAIVMTESILVQMREGKFAVRAAINSAKELVISLLTSSLTTAAAFLPIFLAKSTTGEYTSPLFKVVTLTLLCSWGLSLTMIPLLCTWFLRVKPEPASVYDTGFYRLYRRMLTHSLAYRWVALAAVAIVFFVAMSTFKYLPRIFFPPSDRLILKAEISLAPGTDIRVTEETVQAIDRFIAEHLTVTPDRTSGVRNWLVHIGQGGPRFIVNHEPKQGKPEYALFIMNVTDIPVMDSVIHSLNAFVYERFPDADFRFNRIKNGPPVQEPVQIRVSGRSSDELFVRVDRIKEKLASIEGTRNITDDWGQRIKKLRVVVNQPRAMRAGVTSHDIAVSLQTGLSGLSLTEYREGDKVIPVSLRSLASDRLDIGKLDSLTVYAQSTGATVSLKQVADVVVTWEPSEILRRDRLKTVTVKSDLHPGFTAHQVVKQMTPWLEADKQTWPLGYRYAFGGEIEKSTQANAAIREQIPIAGFIILMLLVMQFNSFRKTLIIMVTIPLGLIGVVIGLHVFKLYFGFMTLLGIVSLTGIVVNNAIVLIERIRIEEVDNGLDPISAILEAAQRRLRPILLTTATTIFGMLPLWIGGGPMWPPMIVSIIFGLLFSTLLTLGVVPVLYAALYRVR
ncbi:MAG: acriflavine resistance protein B [Deltaproteobacteria bacterium]|nr:MAG: acriflavine resistance protein B [Deltaproteobacteria bacterium]